MNKLHIIGGIIAMIGGLLLDSQGKAYYVSLGLCIFGLALAYFGIIYELCQVKRIRRNRLNRMLERERRKQNG